MDTVTIYRKIVKKKNFGGFQAWYALSIVLSKRIAVLWSVSVNKGTGTQNRHGHGHGYTVA